MVMQAEQEAEHMEAYNRHMEGLLAMRSMPEAKQYTLSDHLDSLIRFHQEEIAFQGAEIGALQIVRTKFRKSRLIVGLCEMHARICDDMMQESVNAIERIKAEKKSCRV